MKECSPVVKEVQQNYQQKFQKWKFVIWEAYVRIPYYLHWSKFDTNTNGK